MHGTKNRVVKPSWGVLYTLGTALVGLVGLIEFTIPAGTLRQTLEVAVTLAGFVAMAIWVRLNRVAFASPARATVLLIGYLKPPSRAW